MQEGRLHRRSVRLRGHDYSQAGAYFVTVCTEGRRRVFGTVVNDRMALNDAGRAAAACWRDMPAHFPNAALDEWVVMPDHVHGIIVITRDRDGRGTACRAPTMERFGCPVSGSLATIVRSYKSAVAKRIHEISMSDERFWQRNYYEIIVRNEAALSNIRAYIRNNPANWDAIRYGEPRFMAGNRALLDLAKTAFLASRGGTRLPSWKPAKGECVISGFLSPVERAVFDACLKDGHPVIHVLARGLPLTFLPHVQRAIDAGLLLVTTPFPQGEDRFSAPRAAWCNQYVLHAAERIVIGHLSPDGMLACLLADRPDDKPITFLSSAAANASTP